MKITVDAEFDFGNRVKSTQGIDEGLPKILSLLDEYNIKGIFFIAPELQNLSVAIAKRGHQIGLHPKQGDIVGQGYKYIRGHKFWKFPDWKNYLPYSSSDHSTSLLMNMWNIQYLQDIFYLHPFDIVKPKTKPPNLFCKLWYSQPERAYETLKNIIAKSAERK